MVKYRIEFKKSATKELKKLPQKELKYVLNRVNKLAENPRPKGSTKLSTDDKYRLRAGRYRILYQIYDKQILIVIVRVAHRKDAYRTS